MKPNIKKLLILNAPYLLFVYLFDKVGQAVRLSPGADLSGKLLSIGSGFSAAFSNALPSFAPMDLLIGIVGAVVIRLAVYVKGKNAKKYRKGMEYGSARWGNAEDIKPYIDPIFENNVLLTQTERLMMSSRPKHPKYARNKNVLVIGGSGSGKTRFFVKPNLMQMNRFTVEETNLLSIYHEGSKAQLIENMTAALPYMDAGLRELAKRTLFKVGALTEAEYRELAVYPADEV